MTGHSDRWGSRAAVLAAFMAMALVLAACGGGADDDVAASPADDTAEDTPDDTTEDTADDTAEDTADDTAEDTADDTAEDTPDDTAEDTADDTAEDTADDTAEDTADDDIVAEAEAQVATLTETDVDFPEPPGPFDPGTGRVAIISCGQAGIGCQQMTQFAQDAAAAMGWEASQTFDGEFSPVTQAGFVQQAINDGYDAIILASIDAASIQAAVDAAQEADVPVACVTCENPGSDWVMDATPGGYVSGEAMGWWLIADSGGTADVFGFHDGSFPIVTARFEGVRDVLERCSGCSYEETDIPTTDLQSPGPPTWTGVLSANPEGSFDYAVAPYDFFSIPMAITAQERGRDEITITGFDAWDEMVSNIGSGDLPVGATVAAPFEYAAWVSMDLVARHVAGEETWDATTLPARLVTSENADSFGQGFFATPFDVEPFFTELWQ